MAHKGTCLYVAVLNNLKCNQYGLTISQFLQGSTEECNLLKLEEKVICSVGNIKSESPVTLFEYRVSE